jgi:hypothetical protein
VRSGIISPRLGLDERRTMQATAPLWLTLALAILAPVLSLGGVLWTQRAADNRARNEARLRERADHAKWLTDQRRDCYIALLVNASAYADAAAAWSEGDTEANTRLDAAHHDLWSAQAAVRLLGSAPAAEAADGYAKGLTRNSARRGSARVPLSHEQRRTLRAAFENAAIHDLRGTGGEDGEVPATEVSTPQP